MEKERKNIVKFKAMFTNRIYPHPRSAYEGGYMIGIYQLTEVLEGSMYHDVGRSITVKGECYEDEYGEEYTIMAEEVNDEKYGKQYDIIFIGQPADLKTEATQRVFLSRLITDIQLENLFETLDNPVQTILDEDYDALSEVKGFGANTISRVIKKVKNSIDYSKAYVDLDSLGLTTKMIQKIVGYYGSAEKAISVVKHDPYRLANDIDGIGFKRADEIALDNGYAEDDPRRLLALAKYVLEEASENGNSYMEGQDFMYDVEDLVPHLNRKAFGKIIKENPDLFYTFDINGERHIALHSIRRLEMQVGRELLRIRDGENRFDYDGWEEAVKNQEAEQGWEYTEEQMRAIKALFENQVLIVTGSAGTGKTSVVAAMVKVLDRYHVSQTALSGRAAARMSEVTGKEGYTIHRLLGYNPWQGFVYNKDNPIHSDIIIVDEVSMIGGRIFYRLVQAIDSGAKLILLGDTAQLEAIGVMNILHDLINSKEIPHVRLTKPHRQALKSGAITSGQDITKGEQIFDNRYEGTFTTGELEDCLFDVTRSKEKIPSKVLKYFKDELEKGTDIMELQVITPRKEDSKLSCLHLNNELQEIFNPEFEKQQYITLKQGSVEYEIREGDKVINRKNNYTTKDMHGRICPVYNGDMGIVRTVNMFSEFIIVDFMNKRGVRISKSGLKNIQLGYAITTHSFQGSQADVIIYTLDSAASRLLNREQAYTGISRMKEFIYMVVENKAFRKAINTTSVRFKSTFLPGVLSKFNRLSLEEMDRYINPKKENEE